MQLEIKTTTDTPNASVFTERVPPNFYAEPTEPLYQHIRRSRLDGLWSFIYIQRIRCT